MRGIRTDKRKYYALMLGVLMVVLLAGGTMLQATYGLEGDWSLEMSINDMLVNAEDVWPGEAIKVLGDAENGYDTVILSVDDREPNNPYTEQMDRSETGTPAIGVSLGSFTQPVPVIDTTSTSGSKIYTWSFTGKISVQTFAAIMTVDEYLIIYGGVGENTTEVAELGTIKLGIDVDFNIIKGEDAVGTCVISNISVTSMQGMVNTDGVLAEDYEHTTSSFKIEPLNSLVAAPMKHTDSYADVNIDGDIAAGAEIYEGNMILYDAITTYEVSFEVVQVVGELDTARFGVPTILNFLPTSSDAVLGDPLVWLLPAILVGVIILVLFAASYAYGKPPVKL